MPTAEKEGSRISTVIVRGSTDNIMDDVERAVDDAINTYKALTRDPRFVPGAGATEIELAKQLASYGEVSECRSLFELRETVICSCDGELKFVLVYNNLNCVL